MLMWLIESFEDERSGAVHLKPSYLVQTLTCWVTLVPRKHPAPKVLGDPSLSVTIWQAYKIRDTLLKVPSCN